MPCSPTRSVDGIIAKAGTEPLDVDKSALLAHAITAGIVPSANIGATTRH